MTPCASYFRSDRGAVDHLCADTACHEAQVDGANRLHHGFFGCSSAHQELGSRRPSIANMIVRAPRAHTPGPALMGRKFDNLTIATSEPSRNTSVMLQGLSSCSSASTCVNPGDRRSKRAKLSSQMTSRT